MINFKQFCS